MTMYGLVALPLSRSPAVPPSRSHALTLLRREFNQTLTEGLLTPTAAECTGRTAITQSFDVATRRHIFRTNAQLRRLPADEFHQFLHRLLLIRCRSKIVRRFLVVGVRALIGNQF